MHQRIAAEFLSAFRALGLGQSLAVQSAKLLFLAGLFADDQSAAGTLPTADLQLECGIFAVVIDTRQVANLSFAVMALGSFVVVGQRNLGVLTQPIETADRLKRLGERAELGQHERQVLGVLVLRRLGQPYRDAARAEHRDVAEQRLRIERRGLHHDQLSERLFRKLLLRRDSQSVDRGIRLGEMLHHRGSNRRLLLEIAAKHTGRGNERHQQQVVRCDPEIHGQEVVEQAVRLELQLFGNDRVKTNIGQPSGVAAGTGGCSTLCQVDGGQFVVGLLLRVRLRFQRDDEGRFALRTLALLAAKLLADADAVSLRTEDDKCGLRGGGLAYTCNIGLLVGGDLQQLIFGSRRRC